MTKAELVEDVARAAELTKKDAERLVEIVFESIVDTLNQGEKIELRGFGSFRVRERGARRGRNPKTGDPVDIPAKRVPYFKPGKELKELINEGAPDGAAPASASSTPAETASAPQLANAPLSHASAESSPTDASAAGDAGQSSGSGAGEASGAGGGMNEIGSSSSEGESGGTPPQGGF